VNSYEELKNTGDFKMLEGPSFKEGVPNAQAWAEFLSGIKVEKGKQFANLWFEKAVNAGGVPLRKDLEFTELVKFGTNLFLAKLDEDKKWVTTYCGTDLVEKTDYDSTGEYIDVMDEEETVSFWYKSLEIITKEHKPLIEFHTLIFANKEYIHSLAINFPLRSKIDEEPDIFIALELFNDQSFVPDHMK